jgi:hypothetical protein
MTQVIEDPIYGRHYEFDGRLLPSVTTILQSTKSARDAEALSNWLDSIGQEQADAIQQESQQRGTNLHSLIELYLTGYDPSTLEETAHAQGILPFWSSIQPTLNRIKTLQMIEQAVHHPLYCYAGSLDLLAEVEFTDPLTKATAQRSVLIDWKTSGKTKKREWLGDYTLQLAAYWLATNLQTDHPIPEAWIVLAHPNGAAQIHRFLSKELDTFSKEWLRRLHEFWERNPEHPLAQSASQEALSQIAF